MEHTACLKCKQDLVLDFTFLFNCTRVCRISDSIPTSKYLTEGMYLAMVLNNGPNSLNLVGTGV